MADRFENWKPVLYTHAESISGFAETIAVLFPNSKGYGVDGPGRHLIWPYLAAAYINVLFELGRLSEAKEKAEEYLLTAEREGLRYGINQIRRVLALVYAALGEHQRGIAQLQSAIEQLVRLAFGG